MEIEEIKDAINAVEKDQLLQKYGIIAPKLTEQERLEIAVESVEGAE